MRMLLAGVLPRTVRMRLTALYGALFVVSGAVLLAIASGVVVSSSRVSVTAANQAVPSTALAQAQGRIHQLQDQLATAVSRDRCHGHVVGGRSQPAARDNQVHTFVGHEP